MTDEPRGPIPVPQDDDNDYLGLPVSDRSLAWLHRRLITDDRQLASVLEQYRQQEGWDEEQLAAHLGTTLTGLYRLGLSGRPRADQFGADIQAIAWRHGVPDLTLMRLVRAVQTRAAFVASPGVGRMLAAARDHDGEQLAPASLVSEERATYDPDPSAASDQDAADGDLSSDDAPGERGPDGRPSR
ncbi:MAG TPA: hypothetical protein VGT61_11125 [Thermomicrobiales bacterium]|jgi:hypothetical protein|nr:hypothetical protein [Thermomicrobiales bacterium]